MSDTTSISWTDRTWNPWRGCKRITSGCANCYMFTAQRRYGRDPGTVVRTKTWREPYRWQRQAEEARQQALIFACSWSDFFIEEADRWRPEAWKVIWDTPALQYQILTKRPERILASLPENWPVPDPELGSLGHYPNVWIGVSVENQKQGLPRIDTLREIPAAVRFLSIEPLLEDLGKIDLRGIHWVIVGGESGPGFRPMQLDWARSVRDQCRAAGVPFFFKQSAALRPGMGNRLDGEVIREFPSAYSPKFFSWRQGAQGNLLVSA